MALPLLLEHTPGKTIQEWRARQRSLWLKGPLAAIDWTSWRREPSAARYPFHQRYGQKVVAKTAAHVAVHADQSLSKVLALATLIVVVLFLAWGGVYLSSAERQNSAHARATAIQH